MRIGYARVSTKEQNLDMQIEALEKNGCEKIFAEKISGTKANRPELLACLEYLRSGDTLVVYKLDRIGRTLKHIISLIDELKNKGIQFISIKDNISTEGSTGKLITNILASLSEFERDLIIERTQEGRRIAKQKGVKFGRKSKYNKDSEGKIKECITMYQAGVPVRRIMKILKIGSAETVYRFLRDNNIEKKTKGR